MFTAGYTAVHLSCLPVILQNGRPAGLSLTQDNKALRLWPCTLQQEAKTQHEHGGSMSRWRGESWKLMRLSVLHLCSAHMQFSFFIFQCCLFSSTQPRSNTRRRTEKTHGHTERHGQGKATLNIKALLLLSSMNDGSPGAPSDERSRRCLRADLAPQSHTWGVTFHPTGWLTRAQPLLSFPFYCEEWWLKFPSICRRSCCISSAKDNGHCQCQRGYFCVAMSCSLQG